jgi:thiamine kinase-like enzyme
MTVDEALIRALGPRGASATVTTITEGITNHNYKVECGGKVYALRLGGKDTHLLGIDRGREQAASIIAASIGVGADVIFADGEVLLTRFLPGGTLTADEASEPDMLVKIVRAVRRVHDGPPFPGRFSPFDFVRHSARLARERGVVMPPDMDAILLEMVAMERAAGRVPGRPCHNDLLAANFIADGDGVRIIDWEYAGMGDVFFDLGNLCANLQLNNEACEIVLEAYGSVSDMPRLRLMRRASDLREAFWGYLQSGVSKLDFDFRRYADIYLERFRAARSSVC